MAADLTRVARELFAGVMAPLVMGGRITPGRAIGPRTALALTDAGGAQAVDRGTFDALQDARVRCARRLAPIDTMDLPTDAEWHLGAVLHDVLQAASPALAGAMRRSAATRILDLAVVTLERVPPPATAREALSRHTWLARLLDVARTDTDVSWWTGSRTFRGVPAPARLRAWPELRRVSVSSRRVPLLALEPLAVEHGRLVHAVALLLERSPLTSIATCTRVAPAFAWSGGTLGLVATRAGRTLATRALERLPTGEVDAVLTASTRTLAAARPDLSSLADLVMTERAARPETPTTARA